ncbi:MAG: O-antigen ligase family protein, partial [Firmicutes bacterium]|nr:O-antigen ligase family protein [Bacillota bacterium]
MSKKSIKKKTKEKNSSRHLSELITKKAVFADFVNLRNKKNIANRVLLCLMLVIVSLILFISPFYRGLFFPQELLVANAIIFGLLIVWGLFRTINYDGRLISTPLDICLAVLLIAYLISFFGFAVHKRDALEEVLKIASYIVIYLVVTDICRYWYFSFKKDSTQDEDKESNEIPPGLNIVLHLLFAAATIVTVASLGVAAGHWDFVGAYTSNRIASPMGYANTAAAYLMASYFLTLSLAPLARDKIKLLYLAPAPLMLIAVILTFSRGAWLLLPFLGILMVVISPSGNRVHVFLYLLSTSIPAIPAAFAADSFFRSDSPAWAWLPIIISIIIAMILGRGSEYFISSNRKKRFVISGTIAAFIITGLTLLMLIPLSAPLHLNLDYDESIKEQSYRQLISDVNPQETYLLNMDVNAAKYTLDTGEEPGYVWGVKIIGNNYGRRRVPLFKYEGNATKGWEQFDLNFTTGEETTWFEVILYNEYPGTSFYVRDVVLKGADQEIQLNFALNRVLPERLYNRLVIQDRSVDLRFEFFRDSLKIIKDYPVFGTGGG